MNSKKPCSPLPSQIIFRNKQDRGSGRTANPYLLDCAALPPFLPSGRRRASTPRKYSRLANSAPSYAAWRRWPWYKKATYKTLSKLESLIGRCKGD